MYVLCAIEWEKIGPGVIGATKMQIQVLSNKLCFFRESRIYKGHILVHHESWETETLGK